MDIAAWTLGFLRLQSTHFPESPISLVVPDDWHLAALRDIYPSPFLTMTHEFWLEGYSGMATKAQELENKARVKLELSKKYENLSRISGSKPARGKFIRRSNQLRRQAVEFQRSADAAKA